MLAFRRPQHPVPDGSSAQEPPSGGGAGETPADGSVEVEADGHGGSGRAGAYSALGRPSGPLARLRSLDALVTLAVVAIAVGFTLSQLHPSLLLADNTPAGGDMGAHVWAPAYLRDNLLPKGRVTGWTPDWYAGFPALTFYFPLPSLVIVALDLVLPYGVAFKLVTVAGVATLPIAAWALGRLAGVRQPGPACLAVATLPFLFDRSFTIYGGNIASTLAGEFAFSISLSFGLLFLGVVARGLDTGRHRALAALLLALTGLSHLIPTFFVLVGAAVLLATRLDRRRLAWMLSSGAVAGALASFWLLPFAMRVAYMNDMGWEKTLTYREALVPAGRDISVLGVTFELHWLVVLAAAGAVASVLLRRRLGTALVALAVLSAVAFVLAPQGRLWNARLLPFWFLCLYLLAGLAVAEAGTLVSWLLRRRRGPVSLGAPLARRATAPFALAAALVVVGMPLGAFPGLLPETEDDSFVDDWAAWNYSGYEGKEAYPEYRALMDTMADVGRREGCGRAMWEYEKELDRLGTPMAPMLMPYWTDGCIGSMEGLFFESSATVPYHFLNQAELSAAPSSAMRELPYGSLDVARGVEHLQLFGVRYYMTISPGAQEQARVHPDLRLVATSGPWSITYDSGVQQRTWEVYEVAGSEQVAPLSYLPAVAPLPKGGRGWTDSVIPWYLDSSRWQVPLAGSGPADWPRVDAPEADPERVAVEPAVVSGIRTDDDTISFDVDRPGSPVLVKTSYFPNWTASGAEGPWRVAPNLMVVVPTSGHVELQYGATPVDVAGVVLSLLGLVGLVVLRRWDRHPFPPAVGRPEWQLGEPADGGAMGQGRRDPAEPVESVLEPLDDHPDWHPDRHPDEPLEREFLPTAPRQTH